MVAFESVLAGELWGVSRSLDSTPGVFAVQRLSFSFLCTQQRKDSVPKMVVFWYSMYLAKRQKASKVPTILSWGFPFEVDVEFYLGVDF